MSTLKNKKVVVASVTEGLRAALDLLGEVGTPSSFERIFLWYREILWNLQVMNDKKGRFKREVLRKNVKAYEVSLVWRCFIKG